MSRPDRTVECMVCGKLFPRGPLDLARHQTAVTLKHAVSEKKSHSFQHSCKKCGLYFTKEDHLELHRKASSCSGSKPAIKKPIPVVTKKPILSKASSSKPDKTMECMVCGKRFSRGALDLLRHTTAVTLKHLFSSKKLADHKFQCDKCDLYFTTEEHLAMHKDQSSCNPQVARELGLKDQQSVPPPSSEDLDEAASDEGDDDSVEDLNRRDESTSSVDGGSDVEEEEEVEGVPSQSGEVGLRKSPRDHVRRTEETSSISSSGGLSGEAAGGEKKRKITLVQLIEQREAENKRLRTMFPEERKLFFSLVTLMLDHSRVAVASIQRSKEPFKLTEDNFESFLLPGKEEAVEQLKKLANR